MQIKSTGDARLTQLRPLAPRPLAPAALGKTPAQQVVTGAASSEATGATAAAKASSPETLGDCFLPPQLSNKGIGGDLKVMPPKAAAALVEPSAPGNGVTFKTVPNAKLFVKGAGEASAASPSDIAQGGAQDCWFLSSLATIAKNRPELLEKNIADNGDGTFTVTLYQQPGPDAERAPSKLFGEEKPTFQVKVSGGLPHRDGARVFADAVKENGTPELWVSLYEKALATFVGGYENILPNNGTVGMALIAGAKTTQTIASYLEFSEVAEWFKKGDGLTVVSMPADIAPEIEAYRDGTLMAEHVYYVSNVDTKAGTVEIRNPFGWNHAPITMPWDEFKNSLGWIDHGALGN